MRTMSLRTCVAMDFNSVEFMAQKYLNGQGGRALVQNLWKTPKARA